MPFHKEHIALLSNSIIVIQTLLCLKVRYLKSAFYHVLTWWLCTGNNQRYMSWQYPRHSRCYGITAVLLQFIMHSAAGGNECHIQSVSTIQLCCHHLKAAIDNI